MRSVHLVLVVALIGCGGSAAPAGAPASGATDTASGASTAGLSPTQKRLQGTWEIVRYESDRPIPQEAMPLMGELFDSLRVRIEGSKATYLAGKTTEQHEYTLAEDDGSQFKLVSNGGMFDGAQLKLVGEDQLEVIDKGEKWPGVTVLKRVR